MRTFLCAAGAVTLGFIGTALWVLLFSGLAVLLDDGWDGVDFTLFVVVMLIAVSSTAGAITLMVMAFRKPKPQAAPLPLPYYYPPHR